jgi:transposase-like protein
VYPLDIQMKSAGFRIRVEPDLREAFVDACQAHDQSAAQVLRSFMRQYIEEGGASRQGQLFAAEKSSKYRARKPKRSRPVRSK